MRLTNYKNKVGAPSFIAQAILAGWTALCAFVLVAMVGFALFHPDDRDGPEAGDGARRQMAEIRAAGVMSGLLCPGASWFIIALPLGITALLTMRKNTTPV